MNKRFFALSILLIFSIFSTSGQDKELSSEQLTQPQPEVNLPAGEKDVLSLSEIDVLIKSDDKRDFQKALQELNKYFDRYPEQFDVILPRINRIMKSRELYTNLANQLLVIIKNGQEGHTDELKVITDKLISLERNPGDPRLDIIKDMNYLMSMYQYSAVQNKAAELVSENKYAEAARKSLEGFAVLKDNFLLKYKDNPVIRQVNQHQQDVQNYVEQEIHILDRMESAVNDYIGAVQQNDDVLSLENLKNVLAVFSEYSKIRNNLVQEASFFNQQCEILKKNYANQSSGDEQSDLYLQHADEYLSLVADCITGWKNNFDPDHGITGAFDSYWNQSVEKMKKETVVAVNKNAGDFSDANSVSRFTDEGILPDDSLLKKMQGFVKCGLALNDLYSELEDIPGRKSVACPKYNVSLNYADSLALNTQKLVQSVNQMGTISQEIEKIHTPDNPYLSESGKNPYSEMVLAGVKRISDVIGSVNTNLNRTATFGKNYLALLKVQKEQQEQKTEDVLEKRNTSGIEIWDSVLEWKKIESVYDEYVEAIGGYARKASLEFYVRAAEYYAESGIQFVSKADGDNNTITRLANGWEENEKKYPQQALNRIEELNKYIAGAKKILQDGQKKLTVKNQGGYESSMDSISESIKKLDGIAQSASKTAAVSRKNLKDAANAKKKAEDYIADARKALASSNFEKSAELANKANDSYNTSLHYSFDESLSKKGPETVLAILNEINEKQKMIISDEVDRLIVQASNEYSNNNYTKAQSVLVQALERWNIVFRDIENQEIINLQSIVSTALAMSSGRDVVPGDPLYKEVSNILNSANQYYDKGSALVKKGKKEDALAMFENSLEKLEELRSIVPYNRSANLLRLKIQQVQDPEEFEKRFAEKVEAAKMESRQSVKILSAYNDLCDLAAINPKYPGLQNLILEIEYETGKKKRPVQVNQDKVDSVNLTAQARKIFNSAGTNQDSLKKALSLIGQALVKDGSNAEARKLQSQIRAKITVKAKISTFEITERYNEALEKFNNGDYYGANQIIQTLWENSENRTEKLERLKKRVEARL